MTDKELNEAVARKLGIKAKIILNKRHEFVYFKDGNYHKLKDYCHSIEAAWEIVAYCQNELILYQIDLSWSRTGNSWFCTLGTKNQLNEPVGADTAPMAICKAFLKLKEEVR